MQVALLRAELTHVHTEDIENLFARTDDLNERVKKFEGVSSQANNHIAQR